ncbi:MAG: molecular chaperone DnaJ [Anaerolineaceae bacterium]
MAQKDYYEVLGVQRNATADELKSAFRNLAREVHPDVNKSHDAEERFKEINEAYAVLSDPEKRAAYDRYGFEGLNGMGGMPDFSTIDFSDIFEEFFGFGGGGAGRRRRNAPRRGADLSVPLQLTFEDSYSGVANEIELTRDETCGTCKGSGAEPGTSPVKCATCGGRGEVRQMRQTFLGSMVQVTTCPTCSGVGEVNNSPCHVCRGRGLERKKIRRTVNIPAGVDNGNQIRLAGEGQPGAFGGPNGNLYIEVQVKNHKYFRRRQDDILLDLNINVAQAALGAEVPVPTMDGNTNLVIPPGTQPGKVFNLRSKGFPHLRGSGRGDQKVVVSVEIPSHLTVEQRAAFESLSKLLGTEVRPQERSFLDYLKEVLGG